MARVRASDPAGLHHWNQLAEEYSEKGWYHSIELPDGRIIQGLQSIEQLQARLKRFPIPEDLSGKRVLDIGAWDGWFSFEMERRGAEVVAVDYIEQPGFRIAHQLLGSRVEYRILGINELSAQKLGRFDIVLFLGVLYHLKHPLLGLEKVCELTKEMALVESFVTDEGCGAELAEGPALLEFYETDELCGRLDNWVGPNTKCLLAFCRTAGFARVELGNIIEQRAHLTCFRHWAPEPSKSSQIRPVITEALNIETHESHLSTARDDHLSIWFRTDVADLSVQGVYPEIGGHGIRPIYVASTSEGVWQANCRVPPGLAPGRHDVRIRTAGSAYSEPVRILVDQPPSLPPVEQLAIVGATDGKTWHKNQVWLSDESWVSLWVSGLPEGISREHVKVRLGEAQLYVSHVSARDADELRQVNARLPPSIVPGDYALTLSCGPSGSAAVMVKVSPAGA